MAAAAHGGKDLQEHVFTYGMKGRERPAGGKIAWARSFLSTTACMGEKNWNYGALWEQRGG